MSCASAVQQPQPDVEDLGLPAARERWGPPRGQQRVPLLALGRGQGGERRPEWRGRTVLPSLRGDREEEEHGLEEQDTGKKEEEEEKDSPCIPPSV